MFQMMNKEMRCLGTPGSIRPRPPSSLHTLDQEEHKCIIINQFEALQSELLGIVDSLPLWRGPALIGLALGGPLIGRLLARLTIPLLLECLSVLALFGLGLCWLVNDSIQQTEALLHDRLQRVVLDDALRGGVDSTLRTGVTALGTVAAGLLTYCCPHLVTQEHRLLLLERSLSLSRDEAYTLLCRPGGVLQLWKKVTCTRNGGARHFGTTNPTMHNEPTESRLVRQETSPKALFRSFEACDKSMFRNDGSYTPPPVPELSTGGRIVSCAVLLEDVVTKLSFSPNNDDSCATSLETPDAHQDGQPSHHRQPWDTNASCPAEERPTTLPSPECPSSVMAPCHSTSTELNHGHSTLTSPEDSVSTILRKIVTSYVTEHYLTPHMPHVRNVERVLSASVGFCAMQLVCSRRARQTVWNVLQAVMLTASVSALSSSLIFLFVQESDRISSQHPTHPNSQLTMPLLAKLDHCSNVFARWLIHYLRHLPDTIQQYESMGWQHSGNQLWSCFTNPKSTKALTLLRTMAGCTHKSIMGVARPIGRLLDRTKIAMALVALALARWKHQQRRHLMTRGHPDKIRNLSR